MLFANNAALFILALKKKKIPPAEWTTVIHEAIWVMPALCFISNTLTCFAYFDLLSKSCSLMGGTNSALLRNIRSCNLRAALNQPTQTGWSFISEQFNLTNLWTNSSAAVWVWLENIGVGGCGGGTCSQRIEGGASFFKTDLHNGTYMQSKRAKVSGRHYLSLISMVLWK